MTAETEILTVRQAYEADQRAAAAGIDLQDLMDAAGKAVAREIATRWSRRPIAVLCGPGANGGDGYVAAAALAAEGWPVTVLALEASSEGPAAAAQRRWPGPTAPFEPKSLDGAQLVLDALFGAGLNRPLPAKAEALLRDCETRGMAIISVDLPSGVNGDAAGKAAGYAPGSTLTITFHRLKPAHVLSPTREACGDVVLADIGIPAAASPGADLHLNAPSLWVDAFPWPAAESHKHSRGRLGVVGGPAHQTGAARLAARAGLRIAGLVTVFSEPEAAPIYAAALEAVMLRPYRDDAELVRLAEPMNALVIGPALGLGETTRRKVETLLGTSAGVVVDADALTSFQDEPARLFAGLSGRHVITPHAGEFARLFPDIPLDDRISAARKAASVAGSVVVLKGSDTLIAHPGGDVRINNHSTPWLATAGSGDVLCGVIGAAMAGGMSAFDAASAGVWIHGEAGRAFGPGLTADDLHGTLAASLATLSRRRRDI